MTFDYLEISQGAARHTGRIDDSARVHISITCLSCAIASGKIDIAIHL